MAVRFFCRVAVLIAAGVVYLPASSDAARYNKLERRGKAILQEKCGVATPWKPLATARSR